LYSETNQTGRKVMQTVPEEDDEEESDIKRSMLIGMT
jgi:hypothetical protein